MSACLSTFGPGHIVTADTAWLDQDPTNEPNDHLHIVYGWDRGTIKLSARAIKLAGDYREAMILKTHNSRFQYQQVRQALSERLPIITQKSLELLEEAPVVRRDLMVSADLARGAPRTDAPR